MKWSFSKSAWERQQLSCVLRARTNLKKISLSRRTMTRPVELIDEDLATKLNQKVESFTLYSLVLDKSNDTAQLFIFIRGIDNFEITQEFLAMDSQKGKLGADVTNSGLANLTGNRCQVTRPPAWRILPSVLPLWKN